MLALTLAVVSAQSSDALPCFQEKCSGLISVIGECGITVNNNGTIAWPSTGNEAEAEKCICTQKIIDAYDPCYQCGAEHQRIGADHSTRNLVDSCNLNVKTNLKMPGEPSSASTAKTHSVVFFAVLAVAVSAITMA
ncbi:hypothetical protein DFQ27_002850 [Actinomortierella ambigua]|uniref:Uncharacterized protein n=1 Tax=Actinomortierella ambigua TaxID=1343610 RepID=A0A9P6UCK4_9FUNG|nr:hypothetical protein DFQ27_002850 [Actinomortierella ambigua]